MYYKVCILKAQTLPFQASEFSTQNLPKSVIQKLLRLTNVSRRKKRMYEGTFSQYTCMYYCLLRLCAINGVGLLLLSGNFGSLHCSTLKMLYEGICTQYQTFLGKNMSRYSQNTQIPILFIARFSCVIFQPRVSPSGYYCTHLNYSK